MPDLTLLQAFELLAKNTKESNDIPMKFKETYTNMTLNDGDQLKRLLNAIKEDPLEWIKGLPSTYVSDSTLAKPKTAILNLLKKKEAIDAYGKEYCDAIHDNLKKTFTKHKHKISATRQAAQVDNPIEHDDTSQISTNESHNAMEIVDQPDESQINQSQVMQTQGDTTQSTTIQELHEANRVLRDENTALRRQLELVSDAFALHITKQAAKDDSDMFPCCAEVFKMFLRRNA